MLRGILWQGEEDGIVAGRVTLRVAMPQPMLIKGAGYKLVKSLVKAGCPTETPPWQMEEARYASVSPPVLPDGRRLLPVYPGWSRSVEPRRGILVRDYFDITVSFAGPGYRFVDRLQSCLEKAAPVAPLEAVIARLEGGPASTGKIVLDSPAQFKFHGRVSEGVLLPCPPAWRFIKHGVDLVLGREDQEAYMLLARYLEVVQASLRRVTVYLDPDKPTNWALTGWVRLEANKAAPDRVLELLGWGLRLAEYLGVGKSRLEGLGRARVEEVA